MIQAVASAMGEVYVPLYKLQVGREATTSLCPVWPPASYPTFQRLNCVIIMNSSACKLAQFSSSAWMSKVAVRDGCTNIHTKPLQPARAVSTQLLYWPSGESYLWVNTTRKRYSSLFTLCVTNIWTTSPLTLLNKHGHTGLQHFLICLIPDV